VTARTARAAARGLPAAPGAGLAAQRVRCALPRIARPVTGAACSPRDAADGAEPWPGGHGTRPAVWCTAVGVGSECRARAVPAGPRVERPTYRAAASYPGRDPGLLRPRPARGPRAPAATPRRGAGAGPGARPRRPGRGPARAELGAPGRPAAWMAAGRPEARARPRRPSEGCRCSESAGSGAWRASRGAKRSSEFGSRVAFSRRRGAEGGGAAGGATGAAGSVGGVGGERRGVSALQDGPGSTIGAAEDVGAARKIKGLRAGGRAGRGRGRWARDVLAYAPRPGRRATGPTPDRRGVHGACRCGAVPCRGRGAHAPRPPLGAPCDPGAARIAGGQGPPHKTVPKPPWASAPPALGRGRDVLRALAAAAWTGVGWSMAGAVSNRRPQGRMVWSGVGPRPAPARRWRLPRGR